MDENIQISLATAYTVRKTIAQLLNFYCCFSGTVPKGYPKRQKFFEKQKNLENSNQSHVESPKGAISKYRGEMIAGHAALREELFLIARD